MNPQDNQGIEIEMLQPPEIAGESAPLNTNEGDDPIIETVDNQKDINQGVATTAAAAEITIVEPLKGPKEIDLAECLKIMHDKTILENDTAFFCSYCDSKQKAEKTVTLNRLPPVLMLALQRFRGGRKNEDIVKFPLRGLDLSEYYSSPEPTRASNGENVYDLFAVINQIGSLFSGHYTAKCFNEEADEWYDFNDSTVTKMEMECKDKDSEEYVSQLAEKIVTDKPYVLFYKRRGIDEQLVTKEDYDSIK